MPTTNVIPGNVLDKSDALDVFEFLKKKGGDHFDRANDNPVYCVNRRVIKQGHQFKINDHVAFNRLLLAKTTKPSFHKKYLYPKDNKSTTLVPGFRLHKEVQDLDGLADALGQSIDSIRQDATKYWILIWYDVETDLGGFQNRLRTPIPPNVLLLPSLRRNKKRFDAVKSYLSHNDIVPKFVKFHQPASAVDPDSDELRAHIRGNDAVIGSLETPDDEKIEYYALGKGLSCFLYHDNKDLAPSRHAHIVSHPFDLEYLLSNRDDEVEPQTLFDASSNERLAADDAWQDWRSVQELLRHTPHSSSYFWASATSAINDCRLALEGVVGRNLRVDLSESRRFLDKARHCFSTSTSVYAVSIDYLSRFWLEEREQARDYLASHPDNTVRLFVFSNPQEMRRYAEVLNDHHARYGRRGAVLVCSLESYREYVRSQMQGNSDFFWGHDFGVLENNGTLVASFKGDELKIEDIKSHKERKTFFLSHSECMRSYQGNSNESVNMSPLAIQSVAAAKVPSLLRILRWVPTSAPYDIPRSMIDHLFPSGDLDIDNPVHHVLVLKGNDAKKHFDFLCNAIRKLMALKNKDGQKFKDFFGILDYALVSPLSLDAYYHRLEAIARRGQDKTLAEAIGNDKRRGPSGIWLADNPTANYYLRITFLSAKWHHEYHNDPDHQEVRDAFYIDIDKPIERKIKARNDAKESDKATINEEIDDRMSRYVERYLYDSNLARLELPRTGDN